MISESQVGGSTPRAATYTYNANQRLASASVSRYEDGQLIEIGTAYRYNVSGMRTEAKQTSLSIDSVAQSTLSTRHFLIDAHNPTGYAQVLEETATLGGAPVKTYTLGDDVLSQTTASTTRYLLADGHGSTRALTDASETITASYDYDAYGQKLGSAFTLANAPATDLLYTGEQFDSDLQQYYLRARYYNPAIGRFNRLDPFAGNNHDPQSLHKYAYVHSDPVNGWDPSGMMTVMGVTVSLSLVGVLARLAVTSLSNGYIQMKASQVLVPLEVEVRSLATALMPLNPQGASKLYNVAQQINHVIKSQNMQTAAAILAAGIPGFFGTGFAAGFTLSRIYKIASFIAMVKYHVNQGVSYNNGHTFIDISGSVELFRILRLVNSTPNRPASDVATLRNFILNYRSRRPLAAFNMFRVFGRNLGDYGSFQGRYGKQISGQVGSIAGQASGYVWFQTGPSAFSYGVHGVALSSLSTLLP